MDIIETIFNDWRFWSIFYLFISVTFSQSFKKSNRKMKDAGALTILLELFTAFFALLFIPLFELRFEFNINMFVVLIIVVIIYAITDRLNIEARYGLEPSVFSMLKQLSTVFLVIFGIVFMKEEFILRKINGAVIIVLANILLMFDKGKMRINKYFIMCLFSNLLFAIAMLINVNISDNFNLPNYTFVTVFFPAVLIFLVGRYSVKDLRKEFKRLKKFDFILAALCWALMLISSVRAYQLGDVTIVAPILTLTSILNALFEYFILKNKKNFVIKLIASLLIIIGVILIRFA